MKKEDLMEIKMMFLEALNEYANGGVSTMSATGDNDDTAEEGDNNLGTSEGEEDTPETDKGKGNGNTGANSGGTPKEDGRPKPDVGVGVL